jgi:hypothetical protein
MSQMVNEVTSNQLTKQLANQVTICMHLVGNIELRSVTPLLQQGLWKHSRLISVQQKTISPTTTRHLQQGKMQNDKGNVICSAYNVYIK